MTRTLNGSPVQKVDLFGISNHVDMALATGNTSVRREWKRRDQIEGGEKTIVIGRYLLGRFENRGSI